MSWASQLFQSAGSAAPAAAEAAGSTASSAAPAAASASTGAGSVASGPIANTLTGPQVTGTSAGAAPTATGWDSTLAQFAKGGEQSMGEAAKNFGNNPETYGYLTRNLMSNRPQQPQGGFSMGLPPGGNNPYRRTGRY